MPRALAHHKQPVPQHYDLPPENTLIRTLRDMEPDVTIGNEVEIRGAFQFDGLLRLDGRFQGVLQSSGDLIVGPGGVLVTDITSLKRVLIDGGHVYGSIRVEQLAIAGEAVIKGDITCKHLEMEGEGATIDGTANIHPFAPSQLDTEGALPSVPFFRDKLFDSQPVSLLVSTPLEVPAVQVSNQDLSIQTMDPVEEARLARLEIREKRKEEKKQALHPQQQKEEEPASAAALAPTYHSQPQHQAPVASASAEAAPSSPIPAHASAPASPVPAPAPASPSPQPIHEPEPEPEPVLQADSDPMPESPATESEHVLHPEPAPVLAQEPEDEPTVSAHTTPAKEAHEPHPEEEVVRSSLDSLNMLDQSQDVADIQSEMDEREVRADPAVPEAAVALESIHEHVTEILPPSAEQIEEQIQADSMGAHSPAHEPEHVPSAQDDLEEVPTAAGSHHEHNAPLHDVIPADHPQVVYLPDLQQAVTDAQKASAQAEVVAGIEEEPAAEPAE